MKLILRAVVAVVGIALAGATIPPEYQDAEHHQQARGRSYGHEYKLQEKDQAGRYYVNSKDDWGYRRSSPPSRLVYDYDEARRPDKLGAAVESKEEPEDVRKVVTVIPEHHHQHHHQHQHQQQQQQQRKAQQNTAEQAAPGDDSSSASRVKYPPPDLSFQSEPSPGANYISPAPHQYAVVEDTPEDDSPRYGYPGQGNDLAAEVEQLILDGAKGFGERLVQQAYGADPPPTATEQQQQQSHSTSEAGPEAPEPVAYVTAKSLKPALVFGYQANAPRDSESSQSYQHAKVLERLRSQYASKAANSVLLTYGSKDNDKKQEPKFHRPIVVKDEEAKRKNKKQQQQQEREDQEKPHQYSTTFECEDEAETTPDPLSEGPRNDKRVLKGKKDPAPISEQQDEPQPEAPRQNNTFQLVSQYALAPVRVLGVVNNTNNGSQETTQTSVPVAQVQPVTQARDADKTVKDGVVEILKSIEIYHSSPGQELFYLPSIEIPVTGPTLPAVQKTTEAPHPETNEPVFVVPPATYVLENNSDFKSNLLLEKVQEFHANKPLGSEVYDYKPAEEVEHSENAAASEAVNRQVHPENASEISVLPEAHRRPRPDDKTNDKKVFYENKTVEKKLYHPVQEIVRSKLSAVPGYATPKTKPSPLYLVDKSRLVHVPYSKAPFGHGPYYGPGLYPHQIGALVRANGYNKVIPTSGKVPPPPETGPTGRSNFSQAYNPVVYNYPYGGEKLGPPRYHLPSFAMRHNRRQATIAQRTGKPDDYIGPVPPIQRHFGFQAKASFPAYPVRKARNHEPVARFHKGNFRQSKIEYGFKPPLVPSVQYDEETASKVES